MELPETAALAARLLVTPTAGSTNADLVALAGGADAWPDRSVVVTDDQTAGRGRLGRAWTAPAGASLAVSVLLRPRLGPGSLGWIPLLAGTAMVRALRDAGAGASLKWPNDVLIRERKVCGILAELLPDGSGVVVGAGVNHRMTAEQLPVPTATSLAVEGLVLDADRIVSGWLRGIDALRGPFEASGGDSDGSGLRAAVERVLGTLGRAVRVELPGGDVLTGEATGLDASGRLLVQDADSEPHAIAAGDVTHLRYE